MELEYYNDIYYKGSLSDDACEMLLALQKEYTVVASLKHCIYNLASHQVNSIIETAEEYIQTNKTYKGYTIPEGIDKGLGTLRDEQTIGVAFMYYSGSALLGDETGFGKTVQLAGLVNVLRDEYKKRGEKFRYLVLTESTNVYQIRKKMIQFTGEYVGLLEDGARTKVDKFVSVNETGANYGIVGTHSLLNSAPFLKYALLHPFDLIVIDESSIVKNTSSSFYKSAKELFKLTPRRILLNATPLETTPEEFYRQLALLDKNYLPTLESFKREFCVLGWDKTRVIVKGVKPTAKYFKEAISLRYIARTRKNQGGVYKDNKFEVLVVPLSDEQKRLSRMTTLHQMVSDYPSGVDRNVNFDITTCLKIAALTYLFKKVIDTKVSKSLIYCRFRECQTELLTILEKQGYSCVILNGGTKGKNRDTIVDDYNSGKYDILITNVKRGLDLNICENTILYSIDPNPQKSVQVEGRMTRDFDIIGKSLYMLPTAGREYKFVNETLKARAEAGIAFTTTGNSLVLNAITTGENRVEFSMKAFDVAWLKEEE